MQYTLFIILFISIISGIIDTRKCAAAFFHGEYNTNNGFRPLPCLSFFSPRSLVQLEERIRNSNSNTQQKCRGTGINFGNNDSTTICYAARQQLGGVDARMNRDKRKRTTSTRSRSTNKKSFQIPAIDENDDLNTILHKCDLGNRLITMKDLELPRVAEVHADGRWQLCIITGFKVPSAIASLKKSHKYSSVQSEICSPLINIILINEEANYHDDKDIEKYSCVVDIGQITYIWEKDIIGKDEKIDDIAMTLSKHMSNVYRSLQKLPVNQIEKSMQVLYENCAGNSNPSGGGAGHRGLTKKGIVKISSSITPSERAQHLEQILRRVLKAGLNGKKIRLIDSKDATDSIVGEKRAKIDSIASLLVGATLLSRDAELSGRFKRSGCVFVAAQYHSEEVPRVQEISLINGGWVAVDKSVKEGTEARKFVERRRSNEGNNVTLTSADERILYRLECFAMGEVLQKEDGSKQLDLDLRETLSAMNLPLTPKGAQSALIQSGRWSSTNVKMGSSKRTTFEPWANGVLESARMLAGREDKRKKDICRELVKNASKSVEGRTNLVTLPAVCVDAKRASFRDDAIGVRPRSSTGRKVIEAASKWEILVHICDVSDLYAPDILRPSNDSFDFSLLRKAAESRGVSRYDLPFGPLHLLPPTALDALALTTKGINTSSGSVNRCVTLWAYIDERNGKLLDAGLERTIISAPIALTFQGASDILAGDVGIDSPSLKKAKAVLTVVERNLSLWKKNRLKSDKAAAQRENRLQVKEMIANEIIDGQSLRDDGANGSFQRTRGHQLVDQSLDLYGNTLFKLLQKKNAPIPRASGSTKDRDARVATGPLRRYIDGVAQRQALSVLCNYGGPPMTQKDCTKANRLVNDATKRNRNTSIDTSKRSNKLKTLETHLSALGNSNQRVVPALSTGKQNEVVISGLGIAVKCKGVKGTLKGGERVLVEITELNAEKGILKVHLSE